MAASVPELTRRTVPRHGLADQFRQLDLGFGRDGETRASRRPPP